MSITKNYALGHSESEMARLILQSDFWGEQTREFLSESGIKPGMRVLEIGSGLGDVGFVASSLVGNMGSVTCVDNSGKAIEQARQRAEEMGVTNIEFVESDIDLFEPSHTYDALIGRLILLHVSDPVAILRRLARCLSSGGVVAFQDFDTHAAISEPSSPTFDQGMKWIKDAFTGLNVENRLGLHLPRIYNTCGLSNHKIMHSVRVGEFDSPLLEYFKHSMETLVPVIENLGIATLDEIQIDTLMDRVRKEMKESDGVITSPALIGVSSIKN